MIKKYIDLLFKKYKPNVLSQKIKHIFKDENKYLRLKKITAFLPENTSIPERVYCVYHGIIDQKKCRNCDTVPEFKSLFHGFKTFCSKQCQDEYGKSRVAMEWWQDLSDGDKQTYIDHYKLCYRKSFIEQYGCDVDNPGSVPELRKKAEETNLVRYGNKIPAKLVYFQEKSKRTNMERYGVEHLMMDPKIRKSRLKHNYRNKKYHFSDDDIVITQGYTPFLLDLLCEHKIDRQSFQVESECQTFQYFYNDQMHQYTPDVIWESIIIEVKSDYTLLNDKDLPTNITKAQSVLSEGLVFIFIVYDFRKNKHRLIEIYDNTPTDKHKLQLFTKNFTFHHLDINNNIIVNIKELFKELT